jgi:hypothetical protein
MPPSPTSSHSIRRAVGGRRGQPAGRPGGKPNLPLREFGRVPEDRSGRGVAGSEERRASLTGRGHETFATETSTGRGRPST